MGSRGPIGVKEMDLSLAESRRVRNQPQADVDATRLLADEEPRLKRLAAALGLDPADAEDVLQDAYVTLLGRQRRWSDPTEVRRWFVRVVVNRCRLQHRRRSRWHRALAAWLTHRRPRPVEPAAGVGGSGMKEAVQAALAEMGVDERSLLVMRYFCDYDATEIGAILSIPPATVRGRLRHARLKLAERLVAKGTVNDVP